MSETDLSDIKDKTTNLEKKINSINKNNIPVYNQFPNYPTGCESVALYLLLKYYNIDVEVEDIVSNLKKGSLPYSNNGKLIGGDPEKEFIGDPRLKYSYGVYNEPIKEVALKYMPGITTKSNFSFDKVIDLVNNNTPVMAWVTINLSTPFISSTWYTNGGKKVSWISGEHAVVIFGVEDDQVMVSDPYTGSIKYYDKSLFEKRYNYLGKRVVYYEK